jgi:hypothetical protein
MIVRLIGRAEHATGGWQEGGPMAERTRTRQVADHNGDGVETPSVVSARAPVEAPTVEAPTVKDGWLVVPLPPTATLADKALVAEIRTIHRQAYTDLAFIGRCR